MGRAGQPLPCQPLSRSSPPDTRGAVPPQDNQKLGTREAIPERRDMDRDTWGPGDSSSCWSWVRGTEKRRFDSSSQKLIVTRNLKSTCTVQASESQSDLHGQAAGAAAGCAPPPGKRTSSRGSAPSGPVTRRRAGGPSHGHEPLTSSEGRNSPARLASRAAQPRGPTSDGCGGRRRFAQTDKASATRQAGPLRHRPKTGSISAQVP